MEKEEMESAMKVFCLQKCADNNWALFSLLLWQVCWRCSVYLDRIGKRYLWSWRWCVSFMLLFLMANIIMRGKEFSLHIC